MNMYDKQMTANNIEVGMQDGGKVMSTLMGTQAEIDRLLAAAVDSFKSIKSADSRDFLKKSRQTGGQ